MANIDTRLSEALIKYLGFDHSISPESGAAISRENQVYVAKIQELLRELAEIEVDWQQYDLAGAGSMARRKMAAQHPELSERALDALEWKFTFDWR